MRRDVARLWRAEGIKAFALPAIVLLAAAVALDRFATPYLDLRDQVQTLQERQQANAQVLEALPALRERHEALQAQLPNAAAQWQLAADSTSARSAVQTRLTTLLQSLYFDQVQFDEPTALPDDRAGVLRLVARFNGVPQQLPRLHEALRAQDKPISLTRLELLAAPDPVRGGQQLLIVAEFAALYVPEAPIGQALQLAADVRAGAAAAASATAPTAPPKPAASAAAPRS
jgi:hypothetical protein